MNTSSTYAQNKIHPQVGAKMRILVLLVLEGSKWDSLPLVQVVVSDEYYLILLFVKTTLLFLLHTVCSKFGAWNEKNTSLSFSFPDEGIDAYT